MSILTQNRSVDPSHACIFTRQRRHSPPNSLYQVFHLVISLFSSFNLYRVVGPLLKFLYQKLLGHSLALNAVIDRNPRSAWWSSHPQTLGKDMPGSLEVGNGPSLMGSMPSNNVLSMSNLYSSAFFTRFLPSKERRRVKERGHKGGICGMQREIDVDWWN